MRCKIFTGKTIDILERQKLLGSVTAAEAAEAKAKVEAEAKAAADAKAAALAKPTADVKVAEAAVAGDVKANKAGEPESAAGDSSDTSSAASGVTPKFCSLCGTSLLPGARFCPSCGAKVTPLVTVV